MTAGDRDVPTLAHEDELDPVLDAEPVGRTTKSRTLQVISSSMASLIRSMVALTGIPVTGL